MKCLSVNIFFHNEKKKRVLVYVYKKKYEQKSLIYDLQVVPINCDYEIFESSDVSGC